MKIDGNNSHIEMGGQTLKQSSFRIGNLGMVMKILREMLYSDPINAICREITCNARDAHRVVGCADKPIQIHLPNRLDRNWKVKDFGPGITPDIIENVYLGYGQSTKRNDNLQTGGFGLGSKTPFAKTNQFSIVTVTNETGVNIKRAYIAHIDESEQGSLRLVYESETEEPCGTEISVPVEERDIQSFIAATVAATQYWDDVSGSVRPILTGIDPLPAWEVEGSSVLEGDDWKLHSSNDVYSNSSNNAKIILDGMSYPINTYHIRNIPSKDRELLSRKLRLYFNVGELTPSANREQLQYDDKTQKQILDKLQKARNEVAIRLQQEIEDNESYWDAIIYYFSFCKTLACALPDDFNPLWQGHSVKNYVFNVPPGIGIRVDNFSMQKGRSYNEYLSKKEDSRVVVANENIIYFNDLTTERVSRERIKTILADKAIKQVQVITFSDGDVKAGIERWRNDVGFDITLLCSDYLSVVHIPKEVRDRKKLERTKRREDFDGFMFTPSYRGNRKCDNHWSPHTLVKNGGSGTYVILYGNNKANPSSDSSHAYTIENLCLAQRILGDDDPIIGVRESEKKFLGKNWRPLHVVLQEKVEEIKQLEDIEKMRADVESASEFRLEDKMIKIVTESLSKFHEDSPMSKYITELNLVDKSSKESTDIIAIVDLVDGDLVDGVKKEKKIKIENTDLGKLHNVVTIKYSLLEFIDFWRIRSDNAGKKAFIDYINAVDAADGLDISVGVVKLVG